MKKCRNAITITDGAFRQEGYILNKCEGIGGGTAGSVPIVNEFEQMNHLFLKFNFVAFWWGRCKILKSNLSFTRLRYQFQIFYSIPMLDRHVNRTFHRTLTESGSLTLVSLHQLSDSTWSENVVVELWWRNLTTTWNEMNSSSTSQLLLWYLNQNSTETKFIQNKKPFQSKANPLLPIGMSGGPQGNKFEQIRAGEWGPQVNIFKQVGGESHVTYYMGTPTVDRQTQLKTLPSLKLRM